MDGRKDLFKAVDHLKIALDIVRADTDEQKMLDSALESILESLAAAYMKLKYASVKSLKMRKKMKKPIETYAFFVLCTFPAYFVRILHTLYVSCVLCTFPAYFVRFLRTSCAFFMLSNVFCAKKSSVFLFAFLRDGKEALKYATLAFQIAAKNSVVLRLMGMAYVLTGQVSHAVDAFQRSLAVNKDDNMTKKMLNETMDLFCKEGLVASMSTMDLGVARKIRSAKGPVDASRLSLKRSSVVKRKSSVVTFKSMEMSESSAMDMSLDASPVVAASSETPSFMGTFQSTSAVRDVSMSIDLTDDSILH